MALNSTDVGQFGLEVRCLLNAVVGRGFVVGFFLKKFDLKSAPPWNSIKFTVIKESIVFHQRNFVFDNKRNRPFISISKQSTQHKIFEFDEQKMSSPVSYATVADDLFIKILHKKREMRQ